MHFAFVSAKSCPINLGATNGVVPVKIFFSLAVRTQEDYMDTTGMTRDIYSPMTPQSIFFNVDGARKL